MPAFVGIMRRDAHETMHAGLRLQVAVRIGAGDRNGRALDAGLIAGLKIEGLHLEALSLRPSHVHAQEHLGPILGLGAAGSRMYGEDGIVLIELAGEEVLHSKGSQQRFK